MKSSPVAVIAGVGLWDGSSPPGNLRIVDIVVRDGFIKDIRTPGRARAKGRELDGRNRLAVPGFVNGHQHSHELFHRGRSERTPLEAWMTSVRPSRPLPLTERDVYIRTLAVAAEALRSGTTTICDDVGINPAERPAHLSAVVKAYADAGIRAFVGPTLFDVPFARAVPFAEDEIAPDILAAADAALAALPGTAETLSAFRIFASDLAAGGGRVRAIVAPSAPQRCTPDLLQAARGIADDLSLPLMIHVLETRLQAVGAQLSYGMTAVAHLERHGVLKAATSLIHGVWLSGDDIAIVAHAGASVQHNPWSNLKLGSGAAPVRALLDAGVNVSIGSDGCGSVETVSMHPALASAALLSTLRGEPETWVSAQGAFDAATIGGARALGLAREIGRIAPGYRADIVLYRTDRPPFIPLNDAIRQLVYGSASAAVASVIVDGRLVFHEGQMLTVDEPALHREVGEAHARLRPDIESAEHAAARLAPAIQRIRRRCEAIELDGSYHQALLARREAGAT